METVRGNGETEFCLGDVAQWFVHWVIQLQILGFVPRQKSAFLILSSFFRPVLYVLLSTWSECGLLLQPMEMFVPVDMYIVRSPRKGQMQQVMAPHANIKPAHSSKVTYT